VPSLPLWSLCEIFLHFGSFLFMKKIQPQRLTLSGTGLDYRGIPLPERRR